MTEDAIDGLRGVVPRPGIPEPILGRAEVDGLEDALDDDGVIGADGCPIPRAEGVRDLDTRPGVRGIAKPLPSPAWRYDEGGLLELVGVSGPLGVPLSVDDLRPEGG